MTESSNEMATITRGTQQVCIDLPGEAVRCVVHKPHLQVILRKHRDVVFDIDLGAGGSYSVEADKSDFYCVRDKKLVTVGESIGFEDGERLHIWVSRQFRGHLTLKRGGSVVARYEPNRLDSSTYDEEPTTKPSPLLVMMKREASAPKASLMHGGVKATEYAGIPLRNPIHPPGSPLLSTTQWSLVPLPDLYRSYPVVPVNPDQDRSYPTVAIVDATLEGVPQQVAEQLASSETGAVELDTDDEAIRNWIYGQLVATSAYAGDNWSWLRHSIERKPNGDFRLVRARVHYVQGKARIYFSGYSRSNPVFGPGGHGPGNSKVVQIYAGVGSRSSVIRSAAKSVTGTLKGNALFSLVFGSAIAYAGWRVDTYKDGYDLAASILMVVLKVLVVALTTAAIVAIAIAVGMIAAGGAVAALVVGGLTILVGLVLGYSLDVLDRRVGRILKEGNEDGVAGVVAPWLRYAGGWIEEQWEYLRTRFSSNYEAASQQ